MSITQTATKDRFEFNDSINLDDVCAAAANENIKTLQTSDATNPNTYDLLNEHFFSKRPDVTLRLYGFYGDVCDLAIAERMTNVLHFSADCIKRSKNHDAIARIPNLKSLTLGLYDIETFEMLNCLNEDLESLSLMAASSKRPEISALARFSNLKSLCLEDQQKGIEAISVLKKLKNLTLRSISTNNLDYLVGLEGLSSVEIKLGGIKDFDALADLKSLKYLELWLIRNFKSAEFIGDLYKLQNLFMQSLPNIRSLPSLKDQRDLRRLRLESMKGLNDIGGVCQSTGIEEILIVDAKNQEVSDFAPLLEMKSLKRISIGFGSSKKNRQFVELAESIGIQQFLHRDFVYK